MRDVGTILKPYLAPGTKNGEMQRDLVNRHDASGHETTFLAGAQNEMHDTISSW